jgi:hypothetical protein
MLRHFWYNDELWIEEKYFSDSLTNQRPGVSIEMSNQTEMFLKKVFSLHSRNGTDVMLNNLETIFYPCIGGIPFDLILQYSGVDLKKKEVMSSSEWFNFWR